MPLAFSQGRAMAIGGSQEGGGGGLVAELAGEADGGQHGQQGAGALADREHGALPARAGKGWGGVVGGVAEGNGQAGVQGG
jgi:hypothetical protein